MKLTRLEEKNLIEAIKQEFLESNKAVPVGLGDDAAVIKAGDTDLIVTKDLLIEDVHFVFSYHPARLLGKKSLNVNISDIAAMGGMPMYALLGLGLPERTDLEWISDFFAGLKSATRENGIALVGGDISRAKKIIISVTLIGEGKNIIRRSGAKPGHVLFVSGTLGDARQGLLLLKRGVRLGETKYADKLLKAFLDPTPPVQLGQELSRRKLVSAMIDISDGLSIDLGHICEESGCGAEVFLERLPLSPELCLLQRKRLAFALRGGEDYQLLFSVPEKKIKSLSELQEKYRITPIGRIISDPGLYVIDKKGRRKKTEIKGWHHFRKRVNRIESCE
jgi:thiamine-monophosphate kinase